MVSHCPLSLLYRSGPDSGQIFNQDKVIEACRERTAVQMLFTQNEFKGKPMHGVPIFIGRE